MSVAHFNVGLMGHVDSGKTSLARALSTTASTAAFDKHPQSRERGITLDLGFSMCEWRVDDAMREANGAFAPYDAVQVTLVDCPGHASLVRTVMGAAHIVDLVLLVVDAAEGVQTQTAECLVLAEIACPRRMLLALNKCDLVGERELAKMERRLRKTIDAQFPVFRGCDMVRVSAAAGGDASAHQHVADLAAGMQRAFYAPARDTASPFAMSADHCFAVKGHGSVMTGTVLCGTVNVGDELLVPVLNETRKVKSMQRYRRPIASASAGERCALCVHALDTSALERALVCAAGPAGALRPVHAAVVTVRPVRFYKKAIATKTRYHVSIGHDTLVGGATLFRPAAGTGGNFDWHGDYECVPQIGGGDAEGEGHAADCILCLLQFDRPVFCLRGALYIASRLDGDAGASASSSACRLAFHGRLLHAIHTRGAETALRLYTAKARRGAVERVHDGSTVIVRGLAKRQTNMEMLSGMKVTLGTGESGYVEGGFGLSGKVGRCLIVPLRSRSLCLFLSLLYVGGPRVRVRVPAGLQAATVDRLAAAGAKKGAGAPASPTQEPVGVELAFKRYLFDVSKKMVQ